MSTDELYFSVRESMEQIAALGIVCELTGGDARESSSGKIITAYDVFEAAIEAAAASASALSVKIVPVILWRVRAEPVIKHRAAIPLSTDRKGWYCASSLFILHKHVEKQLAQR